MDDQRRQQQHLDLEERVGQVFLSLRCAKKPPGGDHHDQPGLLPRPQAANHVLRRNLRQHPAEQPQVGDQDQPAEQRDARQVRRQQDRVRERGLANGREHADVLDNAPDFRKAHGRP
jgi:hypothetical protein